MATDSSKNNVPVAIVTGSGRGIGRAVALRLAADGYRVVVNYAQSAAAAEGVVSDIEQGGGEAVAIQADIRIVGDIERLFDETIARFGQVDVLVNNAGMMALKPLADVTEAEFDAQFELNVKGTFFACRQAGRTMSDGGVIINFSSSTTALMIPGYSTYVATKGAVEQLSHVLARELGPRGIRVNVVSPGPTDTPLFTEGKSEETMTQMARMHAFGRIAQPEEIADAVAMLAGPDARWITGQNIRVNGGLV
jgi:3-oxoacyl-[acyl-carrier protein] reductase